MSGFEEGVGEAVADADEVFGVEVFEVDGGVGLGGRLVVLRLVEGFSEHEADVVGAAVVGLVLGVPIKELGGLLCEVPGTGTVLAGEEDVGGLEAGFAAGGEAFEFLVEGDGGLLLAEGLVGADKEEDAADLLVLAEFEAAQLVEFEDAGVVAGEGGFADEGELSLALPLVEAGGDEDFFEVGAGEVGLAEVTGDEGGLQGGVGLGFGVLAGGEFLEEGEGVVGAVVLFVVEGEGAFGAVMEGGLGIGEDLFEDGDGFLWLVEFLEAGGPAVEGELTGGHVVALGAGEGEERFGGDVGLAVVVVGGELVGGGADEGAGLSILHDGVEAASGGFLLIGFLVADGRVIPGLHGVGVLGVEAKEAAELEEGRVEIGLLQFGVGGLHGLLIGELGDEELVRSGVGLQGFGGLLGYGASGQEGGEAEGQEESNGHRLVSRSSPGAESFDESAGWSSIAAGALGGEGDVPDAGAGDDVDDFDHGLPVGHSVAADADRLIRIHPPDGVELVEELILGENLAVDDHLAVVADVDDDLAVVAARVLSLGGGGDADLEVHFGARELPGDDEEDEEEEDDIDHRGQLEGGRFGSV